MRIKYKSEYIDLNSRRLSVTEPNQSIKFYRVIGSRHILCLKSGQWRTGRFILFLIARKTKKNSIYFFLIRQPGKKLCNLKALLAHNFLVKNFTPKQFSLFAYFIFMPKHIKSTSIVYVLFQSRLSMFVFRISSNCEIFPFFSFLAPILLNDENQACTHWYYEIILICYLTCLLWIASPRCTWAKYIGKFDTQTGK